MSLNSAQIRALRPHKKLSKKADGKGLYVEVFPNGSKLWRLKYRTVGKERHLASLFDVSDALAQCQPPESQR